MKLNFVEPTEAPRDGRARGCVKGTVIDNVDPEGRGRVRVRLDTVGACSVTKLVPVVTPNASFTFIPELGESVAVGFFNGDLNDPFIMGSMQTGTKPSPVANVAAGNNMKAIKTRSQHQILLDDTPGAGKILLQAGTSLIKIDLTDGSISLTSAGSISLNAPAGEISMAAQSISMNATGEVGIKASGSASVQAGGSVDVKGATINLNS